MPYPVAEPIEMGGQAEDHIDAATGTGCRQVADFDNGFAADRLAGQAGNGAFNRHVEIVFEKQPVFTGAAPAGCCDDLLGAFKQHQVGREAFDLGVVMATENIGDEAFRRRPLRCTDNRVADGERLLACLDDFLDGSHNDDLG